MLVMRSMRCSATEKKKTEKKYKIIRRVKRIKGAQQDERETPLWPEDNLARVKHQRPRSTKE